MEYNGSASLTNYGNNQVDVMLDLEELFSTASEPDEAATTRMKEEAARKKKEAARAKDAARKRRERLRDKAKLQSLHQELANYRILVSNQKEELSILKNTLNNFKDDYNKLKDDYNELKDKFDKLKEDQAKLSYLTRAAGMELVEQNLPNVAAFGAIPNATAGDGVPELMPKVTNSEEEIKWEDLLIDFPDLFSR